MRTESTERQSRMERPPQMSERAMWSPFTGRPALRRPLCDRRPDHRIFCRPSCTCRKPRRENVRFYPSPAHARGGVRPCKRCRPSYAAGPRSGPRDGQAALAYMRPIWRAWFTRRMSPARRGEPVHFARRFRGRRPHSDASPRRSSRRAAEALLRDASTPTLDADWKQDSRARPRSFAHFEGEPESRRCVRRSRKGEKR